MNTMETSTRICNFRALKTIGGGIYHILRSYKVMQITGRDWDYLYSNLSLPPDIVHGFELIDNGFKFYTRDFIMTYHHNDMHDKRIVELKG